MKFNFRSQIKSASSLLSRAMLGMLVLCGSAQASSIYHIQVNTASLIGNSNVPFSLDFQFNRGGTLNSNTATVSNFSYSGGGAVGIATSVGGVLGNIGSSILFDNSAAFQELFQRFTPGTLLSFDVSLTSNVNAPFPDVFSFAILDKDLFNIPTTGLGDSLLLVNLDSASPSAQVFRGTGAYSGVTVSSVPESEAWVLMLAGLPLLVFAARRKREAE